MSSDRLAPPPTTSMADSPKISEQQVIEGFHAFLQTALAQAKAERLLDADTLASAEADIMISGPALALFFGALRSTTEPPSVPIPRRSRDRSAPPVYLSRASSPPAFAAFVQVWASNVPAIKALPSEHQHDLARAICGLEPLSQPPHPSLNRISADLRAVAIEISQRRTFQERYQADLQAVIDTTQIGGASRRGGSRVTANFVPPPKYDDKDVDVDLDARLWKSLPATPSTSPPFSPSTAAATHPGLVLIRETLYASLADVIASTPSLRHALATDPARAYFSSVGLAILNVALTSLTPAGAVRGVLGHELTLERCPPPLRPFMEEFGKIGKEAQHRMEEDDENAMQLAAQGRWIPEPCIDRVRKILESGVGYDERERSRSADENGRRSTRGRAVQLANRINVLALGMTGLSAFKAYAKDVFEVLGAVG